MKIWKAMQNVEIGGGLGYVRVTQGHRKLGMLILGKSHSQESKHKSRTRLSLDLDRCYKLAKQWQRVRLHCVSKKRPTFDVL